MADRSLTLDEHVSSAYSSIPISRRPVLAGLGLLGGMLLFPEAAEGSPSISTRYSPRNAKRARRPRTDYIILHTTEASQQSSINSTHRYGTCNYLVLENGHIYRVIDKARIATHAGRSMWNGRRNLSEASIGIEVVGYGDKPLKAAQLDSLKWLIDELQEAYPQISDQEVMSHSQVAYGWNKWEKKNVRGRREDALQFTDPDIRRAVGLERQVAYDPDVRAKRLAFVDDERGRWLEEALYGSARGRARADLARPTSNIIEAGRTPWTIAGRRYDDIETRYLFPDGTSMRGSEISDWGAIPAGTKVELGTTPPVRMARQPVVEDVFEGFKEIGVDGDTVYSLAGNRRHRSDTIYFLPDGRIREGDRMRGSPYITNPPKGLKLLLGYTYGGRVRGASRTAIGIAGRKWNYPSTLYVKNGEVTTGDELNISKLERDTLVFFRR